MAKLIARPTTVLCNGNYSIGEGATDGDPSAGKTGTWYGSGSGSAFFGGFNFSSLPTNAVLVGITAYVKKSSSRAIEKVATMLLKDTASTTSYTSLSDQIIFEGTTSAVLSENSYYKAVIPITNSALTPAFIRGGGLQARLMLSVDPGGILTATKVTLYDYYIEVEYETTKTISTAVTPTGGGTVTGGGTYTYGTTATLTATPNTGYKFVKWVNASGTTVSTNASYSLSVTADITLTAVFEKLTYTITFKNEDGTILQASSVAYGDTPSYTGATPTKASTAEYSYSFSGWSPSIAAVTGATTYTAQFTATKRSYAITVSAGEGGTTLGSNTYAYGSTVQISATANEGWEFTGWSDGTTDNPRTITVTGAATYTAIFKEKAPLPEMLDFKIINPRNNMQVTMDNPLEVGQEYLIELTANQ